MANDRDGRAVQADFCLGGRSKSEILRCAQNDQRDRMESLFGTTEGSPEEKSPRDDKRIEALLDAFAWVYCECSFVELYAGQALADEVIAWLRERGFGLMGAYNMAFDHACRAVQADFLFGRRKQEQQRDPSLRSG
ncbi:methyltransferase, FkbM family [mine drainage metagenome]|uniref:Methyltransferase, FkbM family n=1 Tax=mine drainage metagenome TaxID=410659 RepID=T1CJZ6_9ZZZZ